MPFDQSSRYRLIFSPTSRAFRIACLISAMCSCTVFLSWKVQCFSEPLQRRFITRAPHERIHSIEAPLSRNPSTSILSMCPRLRAQSHSWVAISYSPDETRADAISMRGSFRSSRSSRAILIFSCRAKETPEVCSPSRSVVSIISINIGNRLLVFGFPLFDRLFLAE